MKQYLPHVAGKTFKGSWHCEECEEKNEAQGVLLGD